MNEFNVCRWYGIPLSCIECPIREVEVTCRLNTDHKFWDRRRKRKWPIASRKPENRGLIMELCRKTNCNPEYLKHLLTARDHNCCKCLCSTPLSPLSTIPFTNDYSTYFINGDEINNCEFPYNYWFPECMQKKPKISNKLSGEWLDNLYELYNSCGGIDDFECLNLNEPQEDRRLEDEGMKDNNDGAPVISRSASIVSKGSTTSMNKKYNRKSRKSIRIRYPTAYKTEHYIHYTKSKSDTHIPIQSKKKLYKKKHVEIVGV